MTIPLVLALLLEGCAKQPDDLSAVRAALNELRDSPRLSVRVVNREQPNTAALRYERFDGIEWLSDSEIGFEVWSDGKETIEMDLFRASGAIYRGRPNTASGLTVMTLLTLDGQWSGYRTRDGYEAHHDRSSRTFRLTDTGAVESMVVSTPAVNRVLDVTLEAASQPVPRPFVGNFSLSDVEAQRQELLNDVAGPGVVATVGDDSVRLFGFLLDESDAAALVYTRLASNIQIGAQLSSDRSFRPMGAGLVSTMTRSGGPILVATVIEARVPRERSTIKVRLEAAGGSSTTVDVPVLMRTFRLGYVVGQLVPDPTRPRGR